MSNPTLEPELRFYRLASFRAGIAKALVGLAALVTAGVVAAISAPLAIPVVVVAFVVYTIFLVRFFRWGVHETPEGIVCLSGGYQWGSAKFRWPEMTAFTYQRIGVREHVMVDLADGSHRIVRGARRQMIWRGGATDDFAAVLGERVRRFTDGAGSGEPAVPNR